MLINADDLISRQLALTHRAPVTFPDGRSTVLTPVSFVPQLADDALRLPLDGDWSVRKWPFAAPEDRLVSPRVSDAAWPRLAQPGPVFYYDAERNPATIKDWDRVTLKHIHPDDGAVIRRTVRIPAAWKNRRVYLRFDSIYPAGRVYLNGRLLGEHLSGLTPVEYDVTAVVTPGRLALVAVRLLRKHAHVQLDMPRHALEFTGLAQSAYFHATGQVQIADFQLIPSLDQRCRTGTLEGVVTIRSLLSKTSACRLAVSLGDSSSRRVASAAQRLTVAPGRSAQAAVRLRVPRVQLWNDEFPNLYTVTLALAVPGEPPQQIRYRIGFRRFELSPRGAFLNGRPVKFRGVNHLTFHPQSGMYTPKDWLRRNFALMKKANVNAIRTHFLAPPAVADLCDEMGLYLLQELPIDWGTHFIHDPAWVGPILARLHGGVLRDRHHPSLMVWAVGNENMPESKAVAPDGWNHLYLADKFVKTLDPSRPTMFPPPGPANKVKAILNLKVGDIADTHYSFKEVRRLARTGRSINPIAWDGTMETTTRAQALARGWSGVWFSSEYGIFNLMPDLLNAPYQSIISDAQENLYRGKNTLQVFADRLKREWGLMRKDPTCLGGAYFPWLCAGAGQGPQGNPWGWVRWGEDADWGVVTADLTPKPFFWALRVLFSPVVFSHSRVLWRKGQRSFQVEVWNQYNSIDLKDCTLRTMMGGGGVWMGMMREWQDIPVRCAPGRRATVTIPLWNPGSLAALQNGHPICCRCFLLDPRGFRPLTWDILVIPDRATRARAAMPIGPDAIFEAE